MWDNLAFAKEPYLDPRSILEGCPLPRRSFSMRRRDDRHADGLGNECEGY